MFSTRPAHQGWQRVRTSLERAGLTLYKRGNKRPWLFLTPKRHLLSVQTGPAASKGAVYEFSLIDLDAEMQTGRKPQGSVND
jgi:hypothetical protein